MRKSIATLVFVCLSQWALALDLELTQGTVAAYPIGVQNFANSNSAELEDIVRNDLHFSGQFRLIPEPAGSGGAIPSWRSAGADSVLKGSVTPIGANRYDVRFELLDAAAQGRLLLAKNYQVGRADLRALAHHISDEVYQKLTGERGVFSTRIAYVLVQRSGERSRYSLEVADVDGYGPQSLLISSEPIMSPSWSPDGRQIACVSFERKRAQIFIIDVASGRRRLVTDFPGINGAPAWSPDGRELAVVLSKTGSPKIYTVNLANGQMTQRTFGDSIDTEPRYSPDGQSLIFTSGRGGSPQVYQLSLAGGTVSRLTYEGNYNARASWTPNKRYLVMLHREDSGFQIAAQEMPGGRVLSLTSSGLDESPSVSPNSRLVLYATRFHDKGVLSMVSIDGGIQMRLPSRDGDVQEPAWSPYLG